ncbi:AAA family ATPase [Pseudoroseicyclus sp. CXY001]|uniref:ATP-binding protein n=1 Tax=Pseudoroseicyclus sp. CXY001 TaxID=3242492 RepID=UPI003570BB54
MGTRFHITGASGSGVTTLGRALAQALSCPSFDTDDFFWLPTDPPYAEKRPVTRRLALMNELFLRRPGWVLSGSLNGWGDPLIPFFDAVVFVTLPPEERLRRLAAREVRRYGTAALQPGGREHVGHKAFMAWAERYDDPTFTGRSRARHEAWLSALPCPVIEVSSDRPVEEMVHDVTSALTPRERISA